MALPNPKLTYQDYLALEKASDVRYEYIHGEIYAMAGASENHNIVTGNVFAVIHTQFRKRPCKAYTNDMRVLIPPRRNYLYPDVVAVCGESEFEIWEGLQTLTNPNLIIEVLSPSTSDYDKIQKFQLYRALVSLQEYLLIASDTLLVEHYLRQGDFWAFRDYTQLTDTITLSSIACTLNLADIYEKISFPD